MLNQVYIIRIDDKDFCITTSVTEALDYYRKLDALPTIELVSHEQRIHSNTYNFRFKKGE